MFGSPTADTSDDARNEQAVFPCQLGFGIDKLQPLPPAPLPELVPHADSTQPRGTVDDFTSDVPPTAVTYADVPG